MPTTDAEAAAAAVRALEADVARIDDEVAHWRSKEAELRAEEDALLGSWSAQEPSPPLRLESAEPEPEQFLAPSAGRSPSAFSEVSPGAYSSPSARGLSFGLAIVAQQGESDASPELGAGGRNLSDRRQRAKDTHGHQQRVLERHGLTAHGETVHAVPLRGERMTPQALAGLAGVWHAHGHARTEDGEMVEVDERIMLHVDSTGGLSGDGSETRLALDQVRFYLKMKIRQ